jgi:D-lactate dehydrogenase
MERSWAMRVVIFEIEPWERPTFEPLREAHALTFEEGVLDGAMADRYADAEIVSTFIYSRLDRDVLARLPRLRLVATRSTGTDHVDLECCAERGIRVANVPTYGENTVAEHVFALLLAISHRLVEAVDRTRRGDFSSKGLRGFDLAGKTMGVVGTGNIGRCTARIAVGFGMDVLGYDVAPDPEAARRIGFRYAEFETLLRASDVVSLHVPATPATRHLIGAAQFASMKDGAVLINTARGPVVDVRALLEALASGKVAAAGLDVLPEEPVIREEAELIRAAFRKEHDLETLLADHILLRLRNVVITPHSAFNTREAVQRILDVTRENVGAFLAGAPINLVPPP